MDISNLNLSELQDAATQTYNDIVKIKNQIDSAYSKKRCGVNVDRDWLDRASRALRYKGQEHQMLLAEIAKRKKEEKKKVESSVEQAFIDVCKARLPYDQFLSLMAEAKILSENRLHGVVK